MVRSSNSSNPHEGIVQLFEDQPIRSAWVEEEEAWYFSIVDVVGVLTESADPKQYIKRMRLRDEELNSKWGTLCTPVRMTAADGKQREVQAANVESLFRIIQSVPSKKAEPFKMWLAQVGSERIDEIVDPELTLDRALQTYLKKGYSREWINQRLQSIQVRKELTDEWEDRGVKRGKEFAILTDDITQAWSGMTTRQYKNLKNLKKENLRDNMTTLELVLNMLAEASTAEFSRESEPDGFDESREVARAGGGVAGVARAQIEARTGKAVSTPKNARDFAALVEGVLEADYGQLDEPDDEIG